MNCMTIHADHPGGGGGARTRHLGYPGWPGPNPSFNGAVTWREGKWIPLALGCSLPQVVLDRLGFHPKWLMQHNS